MGPISTFLSTPHGMIAAALFGILAGNALFGGAQMKAHIRTYCADLAGALTSLGLTHLPKIFKALSVGDLVAAWQEVKSTCDTLKDPASRDAEFQKTADAMWQAALKDPVRSQALLKMAQDAVAAFASGNPAGASAMIAADALGLAKANPLVQFDPLGKLHAILPHLPAIGSNPQLANLANLLSGADVLHLFPLVAAGANAAAPVVLAPPASKSPTPPADPTANQTTAPTTQAA